MAEKLTLLICTHNRAALLARTLSYLGQARFPSEAEILVVANACSDATGETVSAARRDLPVPVRLLEEPQPGKSHALNTGLAAIDSGLVAFVDDDHRVDPSYPLAVADAFEAEPRADLVCGRILPDWTGEEPAWVHNDTFYPIHPLPVPRYDQGMEGRWIGLEGPLPGGGNLALRKKVFDLIGGFSTELGPCGHNLSGSEDSEFILRALQAGKRLFYSPAMLQYHYVDLKRLTLWYIMQKAYKRSQTVVRYRRSRRFPPRYLYRKVAEHAFRACISLYWPEKRYWLVRTAAALGELSAYL